MPSNMGTKKIHEFARLYWHGNHQVLILKDYDSEAEEFVLKICTMHNGAEIAIKYNFHSEETHDKTFHAINEESAGKALEIALEEIGITLLE